MTDVGVGLLVLGIRRIGQCVGNAGEGWGGRGGGRGIRKRVYISREDRGRVISRTKALHFRVHARFLSSTFPRL